jgi:hypothetical protein
MKQTKSRQVNLQVRCAILKRIVIFLDCLVFLAGISGVYFIGSGQLANTFWLFLLSVACFWGSYELGYIVQHMIIRLELERKE